MRIAIIMATSGVDEAGMEDRRRYLQDVVSPSTEIVMVPTAGTPASIESAVEMDRAAVEIARRVVDVERAGFDAAVIWCGDDPGLEAAREQVAMPVVGPLSASLALATQIGERFSVITSRGSERAVHRRARLMQVAPMLVSVEVVDVAVLDIRAHAGRVRARVAEAAEAARGKGADCCILGCMAMYGMARLVTGEVGMPIIDPGEAAVRTAESLVLMGLSHAKTAYPYPPKD